jgi:hypothetical protein
MTGNRLSSIRLPAKPLSISLEALMPRVQPLAPCLALFLLAALMVSCGSTPSDYLRSLAVTPTAATGHAQFTATGTRINGSTISSVPVLWWNTPPWTTNPTPSPAFTIDDNGNTVCISTPAIAGTFSIWATAPVNPNSPASQMTGKTPQVVAMAQLTCP